MLQRDYFMRMTQMMTNALVKVIFHKDLKNYEDANLELENAAKNIVGLDLKIIGILSTDDVMRLMKTGDVYAGKCLISAELLREYGEIHERQNLEDQSRNFYLKSLYLYVEAILSRELPAPAEYFSKVNELIEKLSGMNFPDALSQKLFEYYEMSGQYSKAEDVLFEFVDDDSENVHSKTVSFYKRLKEKTDAELANGNFSREEIESGLQDLRDKKFE